ncbi:MAG TPA: universal stress protein, partial [Smithella sp.]|nr:universal stress protein [Smithella sp.]
RNSGKPVLVTPEKFVEIESMALAFDGSESATKALSLSLNLSQKTSWPLTVVIVSPDEKKAEALSGKVDKMIQQNPDEASIDCETIILSGKEQDEIVKFIREGSVELIVMGAFGHNRLRELLLGSTTSHVIHKSPIPVLLIR